MEPAISVGLQVTLHSHTSATGGDTGPLVMLQPQNTTNYSAHRAAGDLGGAGHVSQLVGHQAIERIREGVTPTDGGREEVDGKGGPPLIASLLRRSTQRRREGAALHLGERLACGQRLARPHRRGQHSAGGHPLASVPPNEHTPITPVEKNQPATRELARDRLCTELNIPCPPHQ